MIDHPDLPGRLADVETLADREHAWPVSTSVEQFASAYLNLDVDTIVDPDGDEHSRVVVRPHGAVAVLAIDADDRLLVLEQYRHPVRRRVQEIPAGTLDVVGENPQAAAVRELAEEADLVADDWAQMLELFATPGYSTEVWTIFRASELRPVPHEERTDRHAEEADMQQWWLPFDAAVAAVLEGRITNALTVSAVLAEQVRRQRS